MPLPPATIAPVVGGLERLTAEIAGLRTDVQALVQGLSLMVETQDAHSEMLRRLLEAATVEAHSESPMEALLKQFITTLDRLGMSVDGVERSVTRNSSLLAGAIVRGAGQPPEEPEDEE